MTESEETSNRIAEWTEQHPLGVVLVVFGVVVLLALLTRDSGVPDGELVFDPEAISETTAASRDTAPQQTNDPGRPEVDQVSCDILITGDEADAALYDSTGFRHMFTFSMGETCIHEDTDDDTKFIRIEPGDPSDFEEGARLAGAVGERVAGVGDAARWFDDGSSGFGVLSVGAEVEIGALIYRVHVGRTDLDGPERLELATELALTALPRFPYVTIEAPEPEVVTFQEEPAQLPPLSLDDLLFQRVESAEWTLGEGIVSILGAIVDGEDPAPGIDVAYRSASGVVAIAQEYAATDSPEADTVQMLLDRLLPTSEQLNARMVPPEASAAGLSVSLVELAQVEDEDVETCIGTADNPCYIEVTMEEFTHLPADKYRILVGGPSDWTNQKVELAKQALNDSAVILETFAAMPPTRLVLEPGDGLYTGYPPGGECHAHVGDFLTELPPDQMRQVLAREISYCAISFELLSVLYENPNPRLWLVHGLATHLSGLVYPRTDFELKNLPGVLAQHELSTTMPERTWTNWIFFEHLYSLIGIDGVMGMLRAFPDKADLVASLAAAPQIAELYHDLGRALSDAEVVDVGDGFIAYEVPAWELPISGPTEVPMTVPQFGIRRLHLQVPAGEYACAEFQSTGAVRMSWRPGAPGGSGSWSSELPVSFEGEAVMVLTSVEDGAEYSLEIVAVEDNPDCEREEDGRGASSSPPAGTCNAFCDRSTYYWSPTRFG